MLKALLTGLSDLVYPQHCPICQRHFSNNFPSDVLCPHCHNTLIYNIPPFCLKCSRHLKKSSKPKCLDCTKSQPRFDFAWAACQYKAPLIKLIYQFKYNHKTYLRKTFAQYMINFIKKYHLDIEQFDTIVPIPLFSCRLRERGYNQSQLLSEQIALNYHMNLSLKSLIRTRNTEHQTFLSKKERWTNIHDAFRIVHPIEIFNKNILIIDDLLTTGSTASEAASTLKRSGAKTVGVLTLAITT